MPPVRILDNVQLEPNAYMIKLKEVDAGQGRIYASQLMVMDPIGARSTLPASTRTEPTFGLPATWIDAALRDEAAITRLHDHRSLDGASRRTSPKCSRPTCRTSLSYAEVQKLLEGPLQGAAEARRRTSCPARSRSRASSACCRLLLAERISIRDLPTILEGIAEAARASPATPTLICRARARRASRASSARAQSRPTATCR